MIGVNRLARGNGDSGNSRHIPKHVNFDLEVTGGAQFAAGDAGRGSQYQHQLAGVCGVGSSRVLSFGRQSGALVRIPASHVRESRAKLCIKSFKILDAPGLRSKGDSHVIDWSSSGLLIGLGDAIYKHNIEVGETTRVLHGNPVKYISWAGSSRYVALVGQTTTADCIVLADVSTGHLRNISLSGIATCSTLSGKILSLGFENRVEFHDLRIKESLAAKMKLSASPASLAVDGLRGVIGGTDGVLSLYDLRSLNILASSKIDSSAVKAVSWLSPRTVAAGGESSYFSSVTYDSLANAGTTCSVLQIETPSPISCFHRSDGTLLCGSANGLISQRDIGSLTLQRCFGDESEPNSGVSCLAQDPMTGVIACGHRNESIRFYKDAFEPKKCVSSANLSDSVFNLR